MFIPPRFHDLEYILLIEQKQYVQTLTGERLVNTAPPLVIRRRAVELRLPANFFVEFRKVVLDAFF